MIWHRERAEAALREGRVTVLEAMTAIGDRVPSEVAARVQSSRQPGPTHRVDLIAGFWTCTCQGWQRENRCAHLLAVQMVTGAVSAEAVAA